MKTWVRKTLSVGVLAAGALLLAPGAAHADVSQDTWSNFGALNGTQVIAPFSVPHNVVGNAIGVAGEASAAGAGFNGRTEGGHPNRGRHVEQNSWGNFGIGNGTQFYFPVTVPVNIVGNSDAFLGHAYAAGSGVNNTRTEGGKADTQHGTNQDTWGNFGVLNGTQIYAPVEVPINICGNSDALLGHAYAQASCANRNYSINRATSVEQNSWGNFGVLNGTQIYAPFTMPVNLAGNSDALLGHAYAAGAAVNESGHGHDHGLDVEQNSWGNFGVGNGTQVAFPVEMPINICGNALGILGHAYAAGACVNDDAAGGHGHVKPGHVKPGHGGNDGHAPDTDGDHGDDDGDYLGDHGSNPGDVAGDDDVDGYGGAAPDDTSASNSTGGRSAQSAEGSAVDTLTQGFGGLGVLNTLR